MNHRRIFAKIWRNFEIVAADCMAHRGGIAIEWPTSCLSWRYRQVKAFVKRRGLVKTWFHDGMCGLVFQRTGCEDMKLKKPWAVMANSVELTKVFSTMCDRSHEHAIVMGSDTKGTEGYTDATVDYTPRLERGGRIQSGQVTTSTWYQCPRPLGTISYNSLVPIDAREGSFACVT